MKAKKVLFLILFSISILFSCKAGRTEVECAHPTLDLPSNGLELRGTMAVPQSGKLYLWSTYGRQTQKIDSTQIQAGKFSFGVKQRQTGVYMIGINENNMCPIIINAKDVLCEIGFKTGKLEASLYEIDSKENEGWATYMPQEMVLVRAIKDAKAAAFKTPDKKALFDEQATKKESELLALQNKLIAEYPQTYFSKLLQWKQEPDKAKFDSYWNNIDFTDETIVRSKVLSERIESFMRTHSGGEESGFIKCVDAVATRAKVNDVVLEFALSQMLTGFYESGMENMCAYIIDHYINGDACGDADLTQTIKNTATGIQQLAIGNTPPNILMYDINGSAFNLYETAANKKYTLVMFWSSWCEHCKTEAPQVVSSYNLWKEKGFEIVAICIDNNEASWKSAVAERGFQFTNLCGMNQYKSAVAQDYRITKTPTYFLLNDKKEIVLKPKSIKEAQSYLAVKLK